MRCVAHGLRGSPEYSKAEETTSSGFCSPTKRGQGRSQPSPCFLGFFLPFLPSRSLFSIFFLPPPPSGSPGHVPHKCSSTKHRIISPKVEVRPSPYPALTEVQNISGSAEAKADPEPAKPSGSEKDSKVAKAVPSGLADARLDSTQPSPGLAHPDGFPRQEQPAVTLSVSLPGSTILVMTGLGGAEKPLAFTPSQPLVSGDGGRTPAAPPVGLALLPGPGLVLSQNLEATMETTEEGTETFDPDCFLNSPKQGQTYGGGAGLQAKLEPPEPAAPPAYSLFVSTNRFFIQDDGAGQVPMPASPPAAEGTEVKNRLETPMETAGGEGGVQAEQALGEGGSRAEEEAATMVAAELQEELYSIIQTAAAAAAGSSFGLSFDSHFPDLMSELLTEEAPGGTKEASPCSPASVVPPEALGQLSCTAEGVPPGSPQPLAPITDFSPEWSYPEVGVREAVGGGGECVAGQRELWAFWERREGALRLGQGGAGIPEPLAGR